jgi:preprotein translocase subunit YajC
MPDELKPGDRVIDRHGLRGTIIAVKGELVDVRFDTSMRETIASRKLTKLESEEDSE